MRSPILFLIFNRPQLTRDTFQYIRAAKPPRLYIAADGPRANRPDDDALCAETRKIMDAVDWDCEVRYLFQKENLGCGRAVRAAIDWFFANESEGVIIEDDLEFHPDFFRFCDAMLERYRDTEKVMAVTGNNYQLGLPRGDGVYYFSTIPHCWGWASWARAWKKYDWEMRDLETVGRSALELLFPGNPNNWSQFWYGAFARTKMGEIDTWDFQWDYSVFINTGLVATPNVNLSRNVGFCADATHTTNTISIFPNFPLTSLPADLTPPSEGMVRNLEADLLALAVAMDNPNRLIEEFWRRQKSGLSGGEIIFDVLLSKVKNTIKIALRS